MQEDLEKMDQFNEIIYGEKPEDIEIFKVSHEKI